MPRERKESESNEGKITTSEWKTETPLPVVGFSLGDFMMKEAKLGTLLSGQLTIDAYANNGRPDFVVAFLQPQASGNADADKPAVGTLDTTPMLANELNQG